MARCLLPLTFPVMKVGVDFSAPAASLQNCHFSL